MAKRDAKYGRAHEMRRKRVARDVALGVAVCARCGLTIAPGHDWHLDHRDGGEGYLGPSHASCNVEAANRRRAALAKKAIAAGLDVDVEIRAWSRCWAPGEPGSRCHECRRAGEWLCDPARKDPA